jgi:hypothetical protein
MYVLASPPRRVYQIMRNWSFDLRYLLVRLPWDTEVTPPEVVELVEGEDFSPGRTSPSPVG